jgi:superfamily I DNA and/or RNA helicase
MCSAFAKEPAHIGIITPYRAQCTKLRNALRHLASDIKIGSVEEYQGDVSGVLPIDFSWLTRCGMDSQERRVIIITTVRSSRDYINYDLRYTLGFVANPRRFNGALRYTLLSQRGHIMSHTHICVRSCPGCFLQSRSLAPKDFYL